MHAIAMRRGLKSQRVKKHSGDDACRPIGGGRDDSSARSIFFIDRKRLEIDPIEHRKRIC